MGFGIELFLCYALEDELLCKELATHLGVLQRQGFFDVWHDREISAGTEYEPEIDKHLNSAHIILLLVSQYFMNSNYCYLNQMQRVIERHEQGNAIVIPVILRPVFFKRSPFAKLMPLPANKKPVTDSSWHTLDDAFFDVAEGVRETTERLAAKLAAIPTQSRSLQAVQSRQTLSAPRFVGQPELLALSKQQFEKGERILHHTFGEGIILKSEIAQGSEFVDIQFQDHYGRKQLNVSFENLEKL